MPWPLAYQPFCVPRLSILLSVTEINNTTSLGLDFCIFQIGGRRGLDLFSFFLSFPPNIHCLVKWTR